jgi:hypothetical protein
LEKLDKKSPQYQVLVEIIVQKLVEDFDSFIQEKIQVKKNQYIQSISATVPQLLNSGYANEWAQ